MMTLRRFRALADTYGADLRRWPTEARPAAETLYGVSGEARAIIQQAERLDEALASARRLDEARHRLPPEQEAALARLRSTVATRIAAPPVAARGKAATVSAWRGWAESSVRGGALRMHLGWLGLMTSGGLAVACGFVIGSMSGSASASDPILSLLQAAPIHVLSF